MNANPLSINASTPSILLRALLSNLISIGGILARNATLKLESKLLVMFAMVCLPLFCYTSTLLSLRLRRPSFGPGPVEIPSLWNRTCLVAWGALSVVAIVERYLVVLLYMADAFGVSGDNVGFTGPARAVLSLGLFEIWIASCIMAECWRPTPVAPSDISTLDHDKKSPIILSV
ncbi:unnamed protein product [Rhizoctonia solani]|uniref:Uncharacterized protein n=1 Tax=Rhizoctonia solani TaxID=456999 RepID=A0A8H3C7I4_9AGAM|nr:unnamed protein product [Rhizoctonia solani]